jgi:4'-phosphopantetheinyl transferase
MRDGPFAALRIVLGMTSIDIWTCSLVSPAWPPNTLTAWLDADETRLASRGDDLERRRRFVAGRGQLRAILGHYLAVQPADVAFDFGSCGKPQLSGGLASSGLAFNVSHSGDDMLIALTWGRAVGVDLQHHDATLNWRPLARRFFPRSEADRLERLSPEQAETAFYRAWVRKEAAAKALGRPILSSLARPAEHIRLRDLPRPPGSAACVALVG